MWFHIPNSAASRIFSCFRRAHNESWLILYPAKIRMDILPLRYREAVDRTRACIDATPLLDLFNLADDTWSSGKKVHYSAITIGAPRIPPETAAHFRINPWELHGVAIATG
jgi:hypothetical protein